MATTLKLDDSTASTFRTLRAQAAARGLTLEEHLSALAALGEQMIPSVHCQNLSKGEFSQLLRDIAAGLPAGPSLPADFSRADIYGEHD